ncbi:MAG: histidine kinase dimerization/phosphoacceptor domain -containing protein [Sphingomicrobium sp.]
MIESNNSKLGGDNALWLRSLLDSAGEAFYSVNTVGETTMCNTAFMRLMGFDREEDALGRKLHGVIHHSHPDGKAYDVEDCPIYRCASSGAKAHVTNESFFRLDGKAIPVEYWAHPIIQDGELMGAICTFNDITERRIADHALRNALAAKEALLQEVNHRVKNNLQLVMALLSLQSRQMRGSDGQLAIDDALARIAVVSAVHQQLYQSDHYSAVDATTYLSNLVEQTLSALSSANRVKLQVAGKPGIMIDIALAVPLALIICEVATNSMKYAFPDDRSGEIILHVDRQLSGLLEVRINDDGAGLPENFSIDGQNGLGTKIITTLARQIRATARYIPANPGTIFELIVPLDDPKGT